MEQWEKNYYISSVAACNNGSSLVVMSKGLFSPIFLSMVILFKKTLKTQIFSDVVCLKITYRWVSSGTQYTQQSYKVSESFPFKWINKKWREGFHVTSMATAGSRWGIVMSRNAGFSDQVELY